jgi:hypothetical protein
VKPEDIAALLNLPINIVEDALQELPSLDHVTSTQHAEEVYKGAPEGSEIQRLAMVKWLSLCTTAEECEEAYNITPSGSEVERLATGKWIELSLAEITSAENSGQVVAAFMAAFYGSEVARHTVRRLAEMPD